MKYLVVVEVEANNKQDARQKVVSPLNAHNRDRAKVSVEFNCLGAALPEDLDTTKLKGE